MSAKGREELTDFRTRQVIAFKKSLVELAELEVKQAKSQYEFLRSSLLPLQEIVWFRTGAGRWRTMRAKGFYTLYWLQTTANLRHRINSFLYNNHFLLGLGGSSSLLSYYYPYMQYMNILFILVWKEKRSHHWVVSPWSPWLIDWVLIFRFKWLSRGDKSWDAFTPIPRTVD